MKKRLISLLIVGMTFFTTACSFGNEINEAELREQIRAELYTEIRESVEAELRSSIEAEMEKKAEDRAKELMDEAINKKLENIIVTNPVSSDLVIEPVTNGDEVYDNKNEIMDLVSQLNTKYGDANSQVKTADIYVLDEEILALNTKDFSGKKIAFLGDSITYGTGSTTYVDGHVQGYPDFVAEYLGCDARVFAMPGATVGRYNDYVVASYVSMIPKDVDAVIVLAGVNDYFSFNDRYIEDSCEDGDYKGEINYFMNSLRGQCPDQPIYFMTIYSNRCEENTPGTELTKFMNYQKEAAANYDIKIIDLYAEGYMDNHDDTSLLAYFSDSIHPNENGYMMLGHHVASHLVQDQWD